jgi:hypothetical protein
VDDIAALFAAKSALVIARDRPSPSIIAGAAFFRKLFTVAPASSTCRPRNMPPARIRGVLSVGLDMSAYGMHSMHRTKAAPIYKATGNLRAIQILPGHINIEHTVGCLDVDDALTLSERTGGFDALATDPEPRLWRRLNPASLS